MTDRAHDVDLIALIVDSVFHGFSVNGEALIVLSVDVIPALQGMIEMKRIDENQHITDDGESGYDMAPFFISAAKTLPGFLAKCRWFREIADGLKEMSGSWDRRILCLSCLAMVIAPHAPAALYRCKMRIAVGTDFALNCFGRYIMIKK